MSSSPQRPVDDGNLRLRAEGAGVALSDLRSYAPKTGDGRSPVRMPRAGGLATPANSEPALTGLTGRLCAGDGRVARGWERGEGAVQIEAPHARGALRSWSCRHRPRSDHRLIRCRRDSPRFAAAALVHALNSARPDRDRTACLVRQIIHAAVPRCHNRTLWKSAYHRRLAVRGWRQATAKRAAEQWRSRFGTIAEIWLRPHRG